MSRGESPPLYLGFHERREIFFESLQKAVAEVGSDEYAYQMFHDKLSLTYVPDRICEVIKNVVTDSREKYIENILAKLTAIEMCLGADKSQRLQQLGNELSSLYSLPFENTKKKEQIMSDISQVFDSRMRNSNDVSNKDEKDEQIKALRDENDRLLASLKQCEERIKSQHASNQKMRDQLKEFAKANDEHAACSSELTEENEQLKEAVKEIRRQYRIQKKVNVEYAQQISELQKSISSESSKSTMQEDENSKRKIANLKEKLADTRQKVAQHEERIAKLTEQANTALEMRAELSAARVTVEDLKQRNEDLTAKLAQKSEKGDKMQRELDRLARENSELVKFRELSETLHQSNKEAQKDLKQTKQKLSRAEDELQAMSTASQRRQSEQVRELTRELKDLNAKVTRVITQSARSFKVESLEDIPRVFNEAKIEVNKANTILTKMRNILQIKADTDPSIEARKLKQQNLCLDDFMKDCGAVLGVDSIQKCSRALNDLKTQFDELKARESHMCELLDAESSSDLMKQIGKVADINRRMRNICHQIKADDEKHATEKINNLIAIQTIIANQVGSSSLESLKQFISKYNEMKEQKERVLKLLSLNSSKDLESKLEEMLANMNDYQKVRSKLNLDNFTTRVNDIAAAESTCWKICQLLKVQDVEDITPVMMDMISLNNEMKDLEEHLMLAMTVVSPESILPKLEEMQERMASNSAMIGRLCQIADARGEHDLIEKIEQLSVAANSLSKLSAAEDINETISEVRSKLDGLNMFKSKLKEKLGVQKSNSIFPAIDSLISDKHNLEQLRERFKSDDLTATINELVSHESNMKELETILNCHGFDAIKQSLKKKDAHLESTASLFSSIMSIISSSLISITFPLEDSMYPRLMKVIDDFRRKHDLQNTEIASLMTKARNFGYRGESLIDAVDFIIASCNDIETQTITQKMHEDIMAVRALNAKDRSRLEKQHTKAQKTIDDLKSELSSSRSKSDQRELELEKRISELELDLENEHRVHEELMLLICGQVHDASLLREQLQKEEAEMVEKAESALAFLTEKMHSSSRILALQKRQREALKQYKQ